MNVFLSSELDSQATMAQFGQTASSASLATVITNLVIQNVLGKALGSIWVAMNAC